MIQAIVFDFDGVLADSEPLHLAATQEVFADLGVTLTPEYYYEHLVGYDDRGMFGAMAVQRGWELDEARLAALIEQKARVFDDLIATRNVIYPGAPDVIERLSASFPLGIASGALRHEIERILSNAGLTNRFRFIVAAGDTAASKPAADPYVEAARRHGLPAAACVAIEDSRWGIVSARSAGMKCVGITNTYPAAELQGADHVIGSLDELTEDLIRSL
jgi:beta-phosphoglucomutase